MSMIFRIELQRKGFTTCVMSYFSAVDKAIGLGIACIDCRSPWSMNSDDAISNTFMTLWTAE